MTWLRNSWYAAAFADEIGATILPRRLLDEKVIFFRRSDGRAVALADRCAHRYLPLSFGRVEGDRVRCGYHGMCYDADGNCVEVPGQQHVPAGARVRTYPLVERDLVVWIWMGDPEAADPALVPDTHWFTDGDWRLSSGYHYIRADYRLLIDNLLDLSHESFVHRETIGNRSVADSPVTAQILDDEVVRVHRMMRDCDPPPFYVRAAGFDAQERIDRWHTTFYRPGGYVLIENGSMPAGCEDLDLARRRRVLNLITPETATTSHYLWGIARCYDLDDAELTEFIRKQSQMTFDQDKAVLEAQQETIGENPEAVDFPVSIKIDAGPILGRRLLRAMIERERAGAREAAPAFA